MIDYSLSVWLILYESYSQFFLKVIFLLRIVAFPSIDYLSTNKSSIFVFVVDKLAQQIIFAMHKSYSQYIGNSIHWFQKRPMRRHSRPIWQPSRPMRQPIKPMRRPIRPIRRPIRPMWRPIRPIQNRLQHSLQLLLKVLDCLMKTKWLKRSESCLD